MRRLLLFAKRPRLGKVKSRLCPPLTPQQALELYRAFLRDQLAWLAGFGDGVETELCAAGAWTTADGPTRGVGAVTRQAEGDLGRRLLEAFRRCHAEGAEATVIVGVDSPTLPTARVEQAFSALTTGAAAVLAPAADGGYVLIGQRRPAAPLFRDIAWGGSTVHEQTCRRAAEAGVNLVTLEGWYDVDEIGGLLRLREELRDATARRRAPASARFLDRWTPPPEVDRR